MNTPLSMAEAVEILKSISAEEASADPRLNELMTSIDSIATEILMDKDREYLAGVSSMAQSMAFGCIIAHLMENGDSLGAMKLAAVMQSDMMVEISMLIFKFSIGIAAYEELH